MAVFFIITTEKGSLNTLVDHASTLSEISARRSKISIPWFHNADGGFLCILQFLWTYNEKNIVDIGLILNRSEFVSYKNIFTSYSWWESEDTVVLENCKNSNVSRNIEKLFPSLNLPWSWRLKPFLSNDSLKVTVRFFFKVP